MINSLYILLDELAMQIIEWKISENSTVNVDLSKDKLNFSIQK